MNRKVILVIAILVMGVMAGNWIYGNILAKKIEERLEERVKLLSDDLQLQIDKVKVNPLLSKLQFKGLSITSLDGNELAFAKELMLDMPYKEAMRLLKSKEFEELKSLKLKCKDLSVYIESAEDKLLAKELIIDFDGHLTKEDIEQLDTAFPDIDQQLRINATELSLAQTPWMNALGFTPEQIKQFNKVDELSMDVSFKSNKQKFEIKDFHIYSPLLSVKSNGNLSYSGEGLDNMVTLRTQSSFDIQLNKTGITWGDAESSGKYTLGKLHMKADGVVNYVDDKPVIESQTTAFLLEDLLLEYSGKKKAQLEAKTALLGLKMDKVKLDRLAINSSLNDQKLIIDNSEIQSSLLDATLNARVDINAIAPAISQIKHGKLVVSNLQPGLQNALSTFELMTGQSLPRDGESIVLDMSGPVTRPNIKGFRY